MPDDVLRPILDPLPVDPEVKAIAWDHFHKAASPEDFKARFDALPIPSEAKAKLWDLKFAAASQPNLQQNAATLPPAAAAPDRLRQITEADGRTSFLKPGAQAPPSGMDQFITGALARPAKPAPNTGPPIDPANPTERLPTPEEATAQAAGYAKQYIDQVIGAGAPKPPNAIEQDGGGLPGSLRVGRGDAAMGASAEDFGGAGGKVPTPPGEFSDVVSSWGNKYFPKLAPDAPKLETTQNVVGRFLLNFVSPDSLGQMEALATGAEALPVLVNTVGKIAPVARVLKDLPALVRGLDMAAAGAIPGVVAGKGAAQIVSQGVPHNYGDALETGLNALLVGGGLVGAIKAGRGVLEAYPEAAKPTPAETKLAEETGGKPGYVKPEEAAQKAADLTKGGRHLAASQWKDLAENSPVDLGGGRRLLFDGVSANQRRFYRVVDADGKVLVAGPQLAVSGWLDQQKITRPSSEAGGSVSIGGGAAEPGELRQVEQTGQTRQAGAEPLAKKGSPATETLAEKGSPATETVESIAEKGRPAGKTDEQYLDEAFPGRVTARAMREKANGPEKPPEGAAAAESQPDKPAEKGGATASPAPAETPGEAAISEKSPELPINAETGGVPAGHEMTDASLAAYNNAKKMLADATADGDELRMASAQKTADFILELTKKSKAPDLAARPKNTPENVVDEYVAKGLQPAPGATATPEEIRAGAELAIERHNAENPKAGKPESQPEAAAGGESSIAGRPDDRQANAEAPEAAGAVDRSGRSGGVDAGKPAGGEGGGEVAPAPGSVVQLNVKDIAKDPSRFQFKANTGQGGAGEELRGLEKFDPEMAGVVAVWHDPADGKTYIVNGHNRLGLAERTNTEKITARYLDAKDAREARLKGALINIAEGRGESTDAAKVFRDSGLDEAGLARKGISIKGKIASEGLALAKLDPHLFGKVISGDIPPARAAVIGAGLPEHTDQRALYDVIEKRDKAGKRPTNDQIEEMIRLAQQGPQKTETQEGLFGAEEFTRSLIPEKAEISDYIRKQLGSEKKLFGLVGTETVAGKLGERGNIIKAGENQAVATQAAQALAIYDKLSARSGPVSDALGTAAAALAEGNDATKTKQAAYLRVRQALVQEVRSAQPDVRRAEGLDREGALEAGPNDNPAPETQGKLARSRIPEDQRKRFEREGAFWGSRLDRAPYDDNTQPNELAEHADAFYRKGARPVLYVNGQGRQMLELADQIVSGQAVRVGGLALGGEETRGVLDALAAVRAHMAASKDFSEQAAERLSKLIGVLNEAVIDRSPVVVIPLDGRPLSAIKRSYRHEGLHRALENAAGADQMYGLLADPAEYINSSPAVRAAADKLLEMGYAESELPEELFVHVGSGDWERLSLTFEQAVDAFAGYVDRLSARYGTKALEQVEKLVHFAVRRAYDESRGAHGRADKSRNQEPGAPDEGIPGGGQGRARSRVPEDLSGPGGGLFGEDAEQASREVAQRDADTLQGDRLTAQFKSGGQLKKLKKAPPAPQTSLFEETPEAPQRSLFDDESGAVSINTATLGLAKLITDDIRPALAKAARGMVEAKDDILRLFAPAARGPNAAGTQAELRRTAADLERRIDRARAALEEADKALRKLPVAARFAFIDNIEEGRPQGDIHLQAIADVMRGLLDRARDDVQALGTGKLGKYYEHYFPHIWERPGKAQETILGILARRPLEGKKSFLKKRSIVTIAEGMNAGLIPVSEHPVELMVAKLGEMYKYITAQEAFQHEKEAGRMKFVDARTGKAPKGWRQIDDPIATVYGSSIQNISEYPNKGIWEGLHKVADALGIKHDRGFLKGMGDAIGRANQASGNVRTMHGTAEDVLAHEIGHQIDWKAGSGKRFVTHYPDQATVARLKAAYATLKDTAATPADRASARDELKALKPAIAKRKEFFRQLRELADLRTNAGHSQAYTRKREEKMAQLAEMWVGARELFERTAPDVFKEWKKFLNETPALHALRDIEGNTEVTQTSQPYDVGGLVIKGHWWAPAESALLFNNYLSPGLRAKSATFRAYMAVGNVLLQFQLGWSAFHGAFVSMESIVSRSALGIYKVNHGAKLEGLKDMAVGLTPAPIFQNFAAGSKIIKAWDRPGTQSPAIDQMADAVVEAGGRAHMHRAFQTRITENLMDAFRAGNYWGVAWRAPFAATEQAARPIMQGLVPRLKLGAFAKMAEFEIERLGPGASAAEVRLALQRSWDSVDNRMGQLVYDNLGWNRTVKDLMMGTFRTVGWNVGDVRELGGGAYDALKGAGNAARGRRFEITPKLSYLMALGVVVGLYGALTNKLLSGEWPTELLDYYYPKNGEGGRVSMPSYIKEVVSAAHDPAGWAKGKLHPLLTLFFDMVSNRDYFNRPIAHSRDLDGLLELLKHVATAFEPISMQGLERAGDGTLKEKALPFVGFPRAPKYIGQEDAPSGSAAREAELERRLGR